MAFTYNPFTGNFDVTGSSSSGGMQGSGQGGGSAFFTGEVATYADLPLDGTAPLNSRWLVRSNSGTWPFSSYKQAGIYIRTAEGGTDRDDDYQLTDTSFHDVMSDDAFLIFDNTDPTKSLQFDVGTNVPTATNVTLTAPAASGTIARTEDLATVATTGDYDDLSNKPSLGTAAAAASTDFAAASHTHGNISNDGKVGSTSGLPLKTGSAGVVEAGAFGTSAGQFAEGNHTHAQLHDRSHAMTSASDHTAGNWKLFHSNSDGEIVELALGESGKVLTSNGTAAAPTFEAASGGDTVSITSSASDVLSVSSGAISGVDGNTIDGADPFVKWDDTAGKLTFANPLSRPSGAMYVGLAPTTTALGSNAINIQVQRNGAANVASGGNSIAIGSGACRATGARSVAIGAANNGSTGSDSIAIGNARTLANNAVALGGGDDTTASGASSVAIGDCGSDKGATGVFAVAIATGDIGNASLRAQFATKPYNALYWGGQTTNDTATVLNLDIAATNRFTIAANTALAVDILLVARRSDTADKWLVARRFLGIRRDGSNNTSLIGTVQTLGTDQSDGSPSWSFTLTADDTNEALQLEVTGASGETVQWRATAFYRVV